MKIELLLHSIGTISLAVAGAALLKLMGFTGWSAGYSVGAFFVMYYWVGFSFINYMKKDEQN